MNQKTQMTKQTLAESLKKLLPHHSFEKITIKDITDAAGFIRPTFYNHFKDKYDLVEWIFTEEVIRPGEQLFDVGLFREGIRLMLANMEKEKDFIYIIDKLTKPTLYKYMKKKLKSMLMKQFVS